MLELKNYSLKELEKILGTGGKQATDRKMDSYKIDYTSSGWGKNRTYTIIRIPDPFKVYCILKLGIPAQANFEKIRNLYFYFFCSDGFADLPLVEMANVMEREGIPLARQTITKWIEYLKTINYISFNSAECRYYVISKSKNGERVSKEVDAETYKKGWAVYFKYKDIEGCGPAYSRMYNLIGGHPYKKPIVYQNALFQADIDELIDALNGSFLQ